MAKYRKKPVIIDAVQWGGTAQDATPIIQWILDSGGTARYDTSRLSIDTLEGTITAAPFDWIIKGVQGEFYPCKPDIFDATYESAEEVPI